MKRKESKVDASLFISQKKQCVHDVYDFGQILGEGYYGCVRKAIHRGSQITRAIKIIAKQYVISEIHILQNLDHPNIVQLYEFYEDDLNIYLIMEYIEGVDLFDKIKDLDHITEETASFYMKQLFAAINYLHQKNIVHCDLKPENILISSILKVVDFGCSKQVTQKSIVPMGTVLYMAPEYLNGIVSDKTDVWASGVILYILLYGRPPFTGNTQQSLIENIKQGEIYFEDTISICALNLLQQLLNPNPKLRITAQDAQMHPWIQHAASTEIMHPEHLQRLQQFHALSKLQSAIQIYIAAQITSQQEKESLIQSFKSMDQNQDGLLSKAELVQGYMTIYNEQTATKLVDQIFDLVDANQSGYVDFSEFIAAANSSNQEIQKDKLTKTFKVFDSVIYLLYKNGDGVLSREELQNIIGSLLTDEQWDRFLIECDLNHDGQISEEEFIDSLLKIY